MQGRPRALKERRTEPEEKTEDLREVGNARLDRLLFVAYRQAVRDGNLAAIDRALRIIERRARLLGLDRPQRAELTGVEGEAIDAWRLSSYGTGLIDLELDGGRFTPVPKYARSIWERWLAGPSAAVNTWAGLDTRRRGAWHDLVRERACRRSHRDRPAGHAYELDGRYITDEPALYLALGEAVNGPGGYSDGCLAALDDCLRGTFGYTAPATLLWRDAATTREHLSHALTPDGPPYPLCQSSGPPCCPVFLPSGRPPFSPAFAPSPAPPPMP
ncbi:Barstar (barnase inhibitor) [Actinacidiphila rubida]|uniref:Barstar (Barnase inhibitor) n=1 Tax=Actinacidiphila rubida TaxID=310780 RepID=A0A1H8RC27_9ACTN|nr:Barstar (barnase inhibitor) [Actinacidiphila rubida]SEP00282.1 Barstar (barnase inhibitor) [Actinacidiphila rubida]